MAQKIGPREQQLRELRASRIQRPQSMRPSASAGAPSTKAAAIAVVKPQEDTVAKKSGIKAKAKKRAKAPRKAKRTQAPRAAKSAGKETKTVQLEAFLREPGGHTSAEIEAKFGWLAHSARAAISTLPAKVKSSRDEKVVISKTKNDKGALVYSIAA